MVRVLLLLCCAALLAAVEASASWGVAGHAPRDGWAVLWVELRNPADALAEGEVRVADDWNEPLVAEIALAPGGRRLLPFTVWVPRHGGRFTVKSGLFHALEVDAPEPAPAATLLLAEPSLIATRPGWRLLDPLRVSGHPASLAGVAAIGLDSLPVRFGPEQRAALRDWVAGGGRLLLLRDAGGAWPALPPDCAALARPGPFGAGSVALLDATADPPPPAAQPAAPDSDHSQPLAEQLADAFAACVRPDLPWARIYLILIAFLLAAAIGPRWAARRNWSWLRIGLASLALSAGAAALLAWAGRRGGGEDDILRLAGTARPAADGRWRLDGLAHLFATSSGVRPLRFRDARAAWTGCGRGGEQAEGAIADGVWAPRLPLFSSRAARFDALAAWPQGPSAASATIPGLIGDRVLAVAGGAVRETTWSARARPAGVATPLAAFCNQHQRLGWPTSPPARPQWDTLLPLLAADDLRRHPPQPGERLLYVLVELPAALRPETARTLRIEGAIALRLPDHRLESAP